MVAFEKSAWKGDRKERKAGLLLKLSSARRNHIGDFRTDAVGWTNFVLTASAHRGPSRPSGETLLATDAPSGKGCGCILTHGHPGLLHADLESECRGEL